MSNLPIQKHPFDQSGKVYVNKEWYRALLSIVTELNGGGGETSVDDIALLEAIDDPVGPDGRIERSLADLVAAVQALSPQDSSEQLIARLKGIEIALALMPEYQDPTVGFINEIGSGGTPGFAAGVDFTAGTTTSLTLSRNYRKADNLWITFDGTEQGADQFSLNGYTLTFISAIPSGTSKVFVKGFAQN
jgi:hypothetical protein